MNLEIDNAFSEFLLNKIRDNYLSKAPRTGKWHVSDLLFPRYAVMNRIDPQTPTDESIGYFFMGEALHKFIQGLLGDQDAEVRGEAINVLASADYFDGATLIEFKSSRKWTVPEFPEDMYVKQAAYYAFIFKLSSVKIAVVYPTAGRKWDAATASTVEIRSWTVNFTPEDLVEIEAEMKGLVRDMTTAYETKDVSALPECPSFKYGTIERDKEKQEYYIKVRCPFAEKCKCGTELKKQLDYKQDHRRFRKT